MKVTIYSKDMCSKCMTTKMLLDSMDVSYEERNIDHNDEFYAEAKEMSDRTGYKSMPVVVIGDNEPIFGFQPDLITELVG